MKPMTFLPIVAIAALCVSCIKEKAKVTFRNNSTSNSVYNVVWDGSTIATLYPFSSSQVFEEEPGAHTLVFKKSNTGLNACAPSNPVLSEGDSQEFSCSQ